MPTSTTRTPVQLRPGALVYAESIGFGLMPARYVGPDTYVSVSHPNGGRPGIAVQLTADRGAYRRGETITLDPSHVIPRGNVRTRRGHLIVTGLFAGWEFLVPAGDTFVVTADNRGA